MPQDAQSSKDRRALAGREYRKSLRMALVMGVLAGVSLLSQFVPILGTRTGIFPWWMTIVTVLLFAFTVLLAHGARAKRDDIEEDRT